MKHHFITINGETKTLTEWCRKFNIDPQRYYQRKKAGATDEEALHPVPPRKKSKPSIQDLAAQNGITLQTYYRRRKRGMSKEEALTVESLASQCRSHGITTTTYYKRLHSGMTREEALTFPKYMRRSRKHTD